MNITREGKMRYITVLIIIFTFCFAGCGESKKDLVEEIQNLQEQKNKLRQEVSQSEKQLKSLEKERDREDNLTWKDVNNTFIELEKERDKVFSIIKQKTEL